MCLSLATGGIASHPNATLVALKSSWRRLKGHMRDIICAACLSLFAAAILQADEAPQAWVPDALEMPADIEVLEDRAIGATLRMFTISTESDVDTLLAEWEEELRLAGYTIHQEKGDVLDHVIEFSGQGINNAKIVVSPTSDGARAVIDFDATLQ